MHRMYKNAINEKSFKPLDNKNHCCGKNKNSEMNHLLFVRKKTTIHHWRFSATDAIDMIIIRSKFPTPTGGQLRTTCSQMKSVRNAILSKIAHSCRHSLFKAK